MMMDGTTDGFGNRGEPQVGPDGSRRHNAHQQDEDGCHQRPATHAGYPNEQAHEQAGKAVYPVDHQSASPLPAQ